EAVGTGARVGLQSSDRVVEIGIAADMVLGATGEDEGEPEALGGLGRGGNALDRLLELIEPAGGVPVLDRPADRAGVRRTQDRPCGVVVAVLEVDGHWKARGRGYRADVRLDFVERRPTVGPAERESETGARRRQSL